jgi:hypothetical protein
MMPPYYPASVCATSLLDGSGSTVLSNHIGRFTYKQLTALWQSTTDDPDTFETGTH